MVDQQVCEERCRPALGKFADDYGIPRDAVVAHYPQRVDPAKASSPKTASKTAHYEPSHIPDGPGERVLELARGDHEGGAGPAGTDPEPPTPTAAVTPSASDAPVASTPAVKPTMPVAAKPASPGPEETEAGDAQAAARELAGFEASTKTLEFFTRSLHLALSVWNLVELIEQVAAAGEMATATLAHGSPYWRALDGAHDAVTKAKQVDAYYTNLDLRRGIPSAETDPLSWNSEPELYQKQLDFMLIETHIHATQESIDGAIDALRKQHHDLKDEMEELERAVMAFPLTSAIHAEALLFADLGGQINPLLEEAILTYRDAANAALLQDRMAEAAMKTLEIRLRALGGAGLFHAIDTDDLKGTSLDDFNQRRL